jgi:hypothetical protein
VLRVGGKPAQRCGAARMSVGASGADSRDMYARALEEAETRLGELRIDELQRVALSAAALGASLTATVVYEPLVLPLFVGGAALGILGIGAIWRHWDLLDRLADDRDAYVIPAVQAYAARDARMDRRLDHAAHIRSWIEAPSLSTGARIVDFADELEELARELEDDGLDLEPACAIACRRLVTDPMVSPLLNEALPHGDVGPTIARVRAGFRRRTS